MRYRESRSPRTGAGRVTYAIRADTRNSGKQPRNSHHWLFRRSPADFSDTEVVREFATSKDGTKVPLNILRRKGTKLDGSNPTLLQTITDGVPRPGGVWVDKRGVLYVVNVPDQSYQTSLPEYKADATTPFRTIMQGIVNCGTVGVDNKENVYVTGINPANASFFLEIYPKGSLSPSETLTIPHTGLGDPSGLAFDSSGALLVGESLFGRVSVVYRLPAGSQTFTNLGLHKAPGGAIALDSAGNLYVGGSNSIAVYPPKSRTPARTIRVQDGVSALTVARDGELYVGTFGRVSEYAPGAKTPTTSFSVPGHVGGLALSPQR